LVLNKAAGMVVHPAPGHYKGTLVSAVLYHLDRPGTSIPEGDARPLRAGVVHRLDKGTTGVMVVAKTDAIHRNLSQQFKDRKVEKIYQALVFGTFKQKAGTIDLAIGRDAQHRRKFSSRTRYARDAVTHWEVARSFEKLTQLRIKLETGRTHQIRVHFSESHHPIAGDTVYGAKSYLSSIKDESIHALLEGLERPLLHAWRLSFRHPKTGENLRFEAPLPEDFLSVVECLK
jgi:23S rRNA pseudouridine1911/1915/1917 synthase